LQERLKEIEERFKQELSEVSSLKELKDLKVRYLGKKGSISQLARQLGSIPPEERPAAGEAINRLKRLAEEEIRGAESRVKELEERKALQRETLDITLPGRPPLVGSLHPVTLVMEEIERIFVSFGFQVAEGPEIEVDYYNFEALNIPLDHPARDMQDTFYISEELLLRTHTSPVQMRVMERYTPPIRIIAPGKVYRCDADVSHTPMFHQVEGLMVGEDVTFTQLKGLLEEFANRMFGDTKVRFRPSFFPFTEPSAEMDIGCVICKGKGCRVCGHSGWLEILGCGMVDPALYRYAGAAYDPEKITGFAFGLGVERIAMLKYGINDIRLFYENDLGFLSQFSCER